VQAGEYKEIMQVLCRYLKPAAPIGITCIFLSIVTRESHLVTFGSKPLIKILKKYRDDIFWSSMIDSTHRVMEYLKAIDYTHRIMEYL
jgi:hypothetical protein